MSELSCKEQRQAVEEALHEIKNVRAENKSRSGSTAPNERATPVMGSDLGSRFYESVSRHEAASRQYRAAIRSLSECMRQQKDRPGVIDSVHG